MKKIITFAVLMMVSLSVYANPHNQTVCDKDPLSHLCLAQTSPPVTPVVFSTTGNLGHCTDGHGQDGINNPHCSDVTPISTVPEPLPLFLLGFGLLVFGGWKHKQNKPQPI